MESLGRREPGGRRVYRLNWVCTRDAGFWFCCGVKKREYSTENLECDGEVEREGQIGMAVEESDGI